MSKPTVNKVRVETWSVKDKVNKYNVGGRRHVEKVAVRNHLGQFHGATNFKGSVLSK